MKIWIAAAVVSAFVVSPASADMMKSTAMMAPGENAANKEMAMANTDMSKGKMGSACKHYMKAQKAAMQK